MINVPNINVKKNKKNTVYNELTLFFNSTPEKGDKKRRIATATMNAPTRKSQSVCSMIGPIETIRFVNMNSPTFCYSMKKQDLFYKLMVQYKREV